MKEKNKGFTLIELLAVIVILGLLMAIAIPSVTKYITQSRKKTLTTTIGNYASALVADVNNMEYVFTETNTIYAVPVECISVEIGGKNPFGEWSPATENHWAYVLVQYDDETSSYIYGFTFKDSAGYGIYPTTLENLKESGSQIQTDLLLNNPETGLYTNFVSEEIWNVSGFDTDDKTVIKLLESNNEACSTKKYCLIESGTGFDIGDVIVCGDEKFYVLENNNSSVSMLTKYKVDLTSHKQKKNATGISFADSAYWVENSKLKSEYGSSYPAYIFNENSNVYVHVKEYENYLNRETGIFGANVTLINYEQLLKLGCVFRDVGQGSCPTTYSFVKEENYWWTGVALSYYRVWYDSSAGDLSVRGYENTFGLRPVVTMPKENIKID